MTWVVLLGVLAIAGAIAGVGLVVRRSAGEAGALEANPMLARLTAEVHAGEEQVLIHVARSLGLPTGRDDVGYGEIYVSGSAGSTMKLSSRSEIGRGFDAEVRVHRTRRASVAEYFVLRVPGDETVLQRIAALDDELVTAIRELDPSATVRRTSERQERMGGFLQTTR